jgi:hypothetical protein
MTDKAMSPLRRRMIEDMTIRKLAPKTQQGYIRAIKDFAAFLGRSPDTASFEDVAVCPFGAIRRHRRPFTPLHRPRQKRALGRISSATGRLLSRPPR